MVQFLSSINVKLDGVAADDFVLCANYIGLLEFLVWFPKFFSKEGGFGCFYVSLISVFVFLWFITPAIKKFVCTGVDLHSFCVS